MCKLCVENIGHIIKDNVEKSHSIFSVIKREGIFLRVETEPSSLEIPVRSNVQEVILVVVVVSEDAHASLCSNTESLIREGSNFRNQRDGSKVIDA